MWNFHMGWTLPPMGDAAGRQTAQDLGLAAVPLLGEEPSIILQAFLRDLSSLAGRAAKRLATASKNFKRPVGRPVTRKRQRVLQTDRPKCVSVNTVVRVHVAGFGLRVAGTGS